MSNSLIFFSLIQRSRGDLYDQMLGSRRMYKDYPKFPFSPVLMGNNYTGWPSSMKLGSLRSRPLPSSGIRSFRVPVSEFRNSGESETRKRERWRGVDGNQLHFGLTWFGQGKKDMGMQLSIIASIPNFDHGTNLALIILENQGGGKCNL